MAYTPRTYRTLSNNDRFRYFQVAYRETDLLVGIDKHSFREDMRLAVLDSVMELRHQVEEYSLRHPAFLHSHQPVIPHREAPAIVHEMCMAAQEAGVGPMAAVAGAFARNVAVRLREKYKPCDLVIENGGDIFIMVSEPVHIPVFAGPSVLSGRVGLEINTMGEEAGICTSSGSHGHSFSYGKADAAMIVAHDCALADAYATAYCNMINNAEDMEEAIHRAKENRYIDTALFILNDRMAYHGKYKLCFFTQ